VDGLVDVNFDQEATTQVSEAQHLWNAAAQVLRAQVSEAVWHSTFSDARPTSLDSGQLVMAVPSTLVKERIQGRYEAMVRDALAEVGVPGVELHIEVLPDSLPSAAELDAIDGFDSLLGAPAEATPMLTLEPMPPRAAADLKPRYTFEAFVTGTSNRFAHAAALSVAETPARSYNPLFIYGAAGLGKTHLLHAIGNYVKQNYAHYQVRYVSTEVFLNEFVDAIRTNAGAAFKRRYREIDVLMIDDIQFMEGKEGLQEEFFHTFNSLHGANKQIVISSDRQPDAIPTLEDRLRSRFKWGLTTDIQPPDLETRLAILHKKAEKETMTVPDDVMEFIAVAITDNIRELEGALTRVLAWASLTHAPLNTDAAEKVLGDILSSHQPREITPTLILDKTSDMFGFGVDELKGKSRRKPLVTARQIGMFVMREITDLSYPAIAREFGGRDHTTVIHAVEKITALMKERQQIYDQVTELRQRIQSGA
jgi:chromosomal replication initiator protein